LSEMQGSGEEAKPSPLDPSTLSARELFLYFSAELKRLEREWTLKNELQEEARKIQANVWENHFSRLNGEYKRADEKARDYLQVDIYNSKHTTIENKIDLNTAATGEMRPTLNNLVSDVRTLSAWKDEIAKVVNDQKSRIDRAYAWGAGAVAVIFVLWAVVAKFWKP
jgi:hypothetical protein